MHIYNSFVFSTIQPPFLCRTEHIVAFAKLLTPSLRPSLTFQFLPHSTQTKRQMERHPQRPPSQRRYIHLPQSRPRPSTAK